MRPWTLLCLSSFRRIRFSQHTWLSTAKQTKPVWSVRNEGYTSVKIVITTVFICTTKVPQVIANLYIFWPYLATILIPRSHPNTSELVLQLRTRQCSILESSPENCNTCIVLDEIVKGWLLSFLWSQKLLSHLLLAYVWHHFVWVNSKKITLGNWTGIE